MFGAGFVTGGTELEPEELPELDGLSELELESDELSELDESSELADEDDDESRKLVLEEDADASSPQESSISVKIPDKAITEAMQMEMMATNFPPFFGFTGAGAAFFVISGRISPQVLQKTSLSSIFAPHLLQNIVCPLSSVDFRFSILFPASLHNSHCSMYLYLTTYSKFLQAFSGGLIVRRPPLAPVQSPAVVILNQHLRS